MKKNTQSLNLWGLNGLVKHILELELTDILTSLYKSN